MNDNELSSLYHSNIVFTIKGAFIRNFQVDISILISDYTLLRFIINKSLPIANLNVIDGFPPRAWHGVFFSLFSLFFLFFYLFFPRLSAKRSKKKSIKETKNILFHARKWKRALTPPNGDRQRNSTYKST